MGRSLSASFALCLLICFTGLAGCASGPDETVWPPASAAERERAIRAVREELVAVDPSGQYEIDPDVRRIEGGGLSVIVWRLPKVPDRFTLYRVDDAGRVMPFDVSVRGPAAAQQTR